MSLYTNRYSHIFFDENDPASISQKAARALDLARREKPARAAACVLSTEHTKKTGEPDTAFWLSGFIISYLHSGYSSEDFPEAVPLHQPPTLSRAHRSTQMIQPTYSILEGKGVRL
jgi:hypothetical protein